MFTKYASLERLLYNVQAHGKCIQSIENNYHWNHSQMCDNLAKSRTYFFFFSLNNSKSIIDRTHARVPKWWTIDFYLFISSKAVDSANEFGSSLWFVPFSVSIQTRIIFIDTPPHKMILFKKRKNLDEINA